MRSINWWIYARWHQWDAWQATIIQPRGAISHIRKAQRVQLRCISWFHRVALMNNWGWNGFNVILTDCLWRRTAQQEAQHIVLYSPISRSNINYIFGGDWTALSPLLAVHWHVPLYITLVKSVLAQVMMCSSLLQCVSPSHSRNVSLVSRSGLSHLPCCRAEFRLVYSCSFDFVLLFFFEINDAFKGFDVRWFTNVWDFKINIYKWLQSETSCFNADLFFYTLTVSLSLFSPHVTAVSKLDWLMSCRVC